MSPEAKPNPNRFVREYVESDGPREWQHREMAQQLYEWADVFRRYFFSQKNPEQQELPQPLVAIAPMRVDVLAGYRLVPNPNGLPYEITLNSLYISRPPWESLETLLHVMWDTLHLHSVPYRPVCQAVNWLREGKEWFHT